MTALAHWRTYPTEIAADLALFYRRHIREWHSGEMSSRELLELIEFLPDTSAYQTARRRGDWSVDQYVQARIGEELAYSRADNAGYLPNVELFQSPMQQHMKNAVDTYVANAHQRNLDEMRRKRKGGVTNGD